MRSATATLSMAAQLLGRRCLARPLPLWSLTNGKRYKATEVDKQGPEVFGVTPMETPDKAKEPGPPGPVGLWQEF